MTTENIQYSANKDIVDSAARRVDMSTVKESENLPDNKSLIKEPKEGAQHRLYVFFAILGILTIGYSLLFYIDVDSRYMSHVMDLCFSAHLDASGRQICDDKLDVGKYYILSTIPLLIFLATKVIQIAFPERKEESEKSLREEAIDKIDNGLASLLSQRLEARETSMLQKLDYHEEIKNAEKRFNAIINSYVESECNPETMLIRPLILDTSYKHTSSFHNSMNNARAILDILHSENYSDISLEDSQKFVSAVDDMDNKWSILWRESTIVGIPGINDNHRRKAKSLLSLILDHSSAAEEKDLARKHLDSILDTYLGNRPYAIDKISSMLNKEISAQDTRKIFP